MLFAVLFWLNLECHRVHSKPIKANPRIRTNWGHNFQYFDQFIIDHVSRNWEKIHYQYGGPISLLNLVLLLFQRFFCLPKEKIRCTVPWLKKKVWPVNSSDCKIKTVIYSSITFVSYRDIKLIRRNTLELVWHSAPKRRLIPLRCKNVRGWYFIDANFDIGKAILY